jgi:hypothetical protein
VAKAKPAAPEEMVALYEKLVKTVPEVERKGAAFPYTSWNGNMFSLLTKEGRLALRLPAEAREAFLRKYKSGLSVQYGAVMKEYVDVPDALLRDTAALRPFFSASYEYAKTLKAKATKRPPEGKGALTKTAPRRKGRR